MLSFICARSAQDFSTIPQSLPRVESIELKIRSICTYSETRIHCFGKQSFRNFAFFQIICGNTSKNYSSYSFRSTVAYEAQSVPHTIAKKKYLLCITFHINIEFQSEKRDEKGWSKHIFRNRKFSRKDIFPKTCLLTVLTTFFHSFFSILRLNVDIESLSNSDGRKILVWV